MKFLDCKKVLCLSAHPDDAEYGMLGTMILNKDTNFDVAVMSSGGDFDETSGDGRNGECQKIWDEYLNINGKFVNGSHIKDKTEDAWINLVESKYTISDYDIIMTTPNIDSHFEHRIANNIAWALIRNCSTGLVTYKTPSTLEDWKPNVYIGLDKFFAGEEKLKMLQNFTSQKDKSYFMDKSLRAFHTNYNGLKFGFELVEHFRIERMFIR
jgi:LmbE family N-acetylglucosaminyl deacetylase